MDGSSKFGSDNKYAPFWSFGAGLNIHNYKYFKEQGVFDLLKLRASYGPVSYTHLDVYKRQ